jgi:glutamate dehydrogenase
MSSLERQKVLDRQDEELPDWETLLERLGRGQSLTRPELCILLAYSKLNLTSRILAGSLPDDPAARMYLRDYFPERAREAAGDELDRHRLRREIIAGQFTNELVDLMGSSFVERVVRDTGRGASDVARAWLITAGLANARELIERLREAEERLPAPVVGRWYLGLARVMERTVRWILAHVEGTEPVAEVVAASALGLGRLREAFGDVVSGADRGLYEDLVDELKELGAGEDFARGLITLRFLDQLLEILRVARVCDADPVDSARAFYRMAEVLRLTWLRHTLQSAAGDDRWEQRVVQGLMEDLTRAHHRVTVLLMERVRVGGDVEAEAAALVATHAPEVQRFQDLLQELGDEERVSVAGVSVAVREVTLMAERMEGGAPS